MHFRYFPLRQFCRIRAYIHEFHLVIPAFHFTHAHRNHRDIIFSCNLLGTKQNGSILIQKLCPEIQIMPVRSLIPNKTSQKQTIFRTITAITRKVSSLATSTAPNRDRICCIIRLVTLLRIGLYKARKSASVSHKLYEDIHSQFP